jgi:hypothetical protein
MQPGIIIRARLLLNHILKQIEKLTLLFACEEAPLSLF